VILEDKGEFRIALPNEICVTHGSRNQRAFQRRTNHSSSSIWINKQVFRSK